MKPAIKELRERDADAAQQILGKFQEKLAEFS
jgi:hypothetical protein